MTDQEIIELLKAAHRYTCPERKESTEAIAMDATFPELGIESVTAMSMAGFIEDELGIELPDDELSRVGTVQELARLIQAQVPAAR